MNKTTLTRILVNLAERLVEVNEENVEVITIAEIESDPEDVRIVEEVVAEPDLSLKEKLELAIFKKMISTTNNPNPNSHNMHRIFLKISDRKSPTSKQKIGEENIWISYIII